ncbi:MAG TPA: DNA repair protein RecO [Chromobacteriaceae bacterium]|nr:DNA repair protein RecO [Chromobacteriaceae bacterium]
MSQGKVDRQLAYVLHAQPYRETSLLVEVLTRDYGRFSLVARGARRPRADLRGILLPFQPLTLAWFGKNEVRTLHTAEWNGGVPQLSGLPLICGFYLNELWMKLTARDDPQPEAFAIYDQAVRGLARSAGLATVLRRYELGILREMGYVPALDRDGHGQPIVASANYLCAAGAAPELDQGQPLIGQLAQVRGSSLLAMARDDFSDKTTRLEARALLRVWLTGLLGAEPLASRELLQAINALSD